MHILHYISLEILSHFSFEDFSHLFLVSDQLPICVNTRVFNNERKQSKVLLAVESSVVSKYFGL
jgi:hypothetical protein